MIRCTLQKTPYTCHKVVGNSHEEAFECTCCRWSCNTNQGKKCWDIEIKRKKEREKDLKEKQKKKVILTKAPKAQNQQKVIEEELQKLKIKVRKIKSKIFFKDKLVDEEDNYLN